VEDIELNEQKAVAIMMGNLKGPKNKPSNLLEFAEACKFLKNKWGFSEMSRYFKTSQYMLRQIDKINELNPKLRNMIKNEKLGIEASYQLWRIKEPMRTKVADIIQDMTTEQIRTFVYMIKKNPTASLENIKKMFQKEEGKIRMLVLPLDEETFDKLSKSASKSKESIHNYALQLLQKRLK